MLKLNKIYRIVFIYLIYTVLKISRVSKKINNLDCNFHCKNFSRILAKNPSPPPAHLLRKVAEQKDASGTGKVGSRKC